MRVTAIIPLYPPDSRVGAWLASHELLRALVVAGHEVVVIPFLNIPGRSYELDGVQVWPVARQSEAMSSADVVISHLGDNGWSHKKAVELGKPSVKMVHGGIVDTRLLNGAALVVCNSYATQALLGRWSGRKIVVHPPTDQERFRTTPGDHVTLVNMSSEKGGEIFWRTARALPRVPFLGVLGGYGQQMYGKAENVEVIQNTSNMRDDVYARTKILMMPSVAESWGMVAIEAMCSGIPVLARPTNGLREALGDAGIWQEGFSTQRWAAQVQQLLIPEVWEAASQKCLDRVAELDPVDDCARFVEAIGSLA